MKFMHDVFVEWSKAKILDLNEHYIQETFVEEGQYVYDIGHNADRFYIVREGELIMETLLEYETTVKFPADTHSWELDQTTKTIQYHIRDIHKGDFFGHEEMLHEADLSSNTRRRKIIEDMPLRKSRVRAMNQVKLLYINYADFKEQFPDKTLEKLRDMHSHLIDIGYILQQMIKFSTLRKQ